MYRIGYNLSECIYNLNIKESQNRYAEQLVLPILVYVLICNNEFNTATVNKRKQRGKVTKDKQSTPAPEAKDLDEWTEEEKKNYQKADCSRKKDKPQQWKLTNPFEIVRATGSIRTETVRPYKVLCEKAEEIIRSIQFPYHDLFIENTSGNTMEIADWEIAKALAQNSRWVGHYQEFGEIGLFLRSIIEEAPEHFYHPDKDKYDKPILKARARDVPKSEHEERVETSVEIDTLLRLYIANGIDGILMDTAGVCTFTDRGWQYHNDHNNLLDTYYWYNCYDGSNENREDLLTDLLSAEKISDNFAELYQYLSDNVHISTDDLHAIMDYYLNKDRLEKMRYLQEYCEKYLDDFVAFFEKGVPFEPDLELDVNLFKDIRDSMDPMEHIRTASTGDSVCVKRILATEIWDLYFSYENGYLNEAPAVCRFWSMDNAECENCEFKKHFSEETFECKYGFKPALEALVSAPELGSHREALRKKLQRDFAKKQIELKG